MNKPVTFDHLGEIAVIGIASRFPGANNTDEFWQNLRDGVESITFFSAHELQSSGIDPSVLHDSNYIKAKPVLEDIEFFDASFFGFSPREAAILDPQQRLFLECAWESLESAGYNSEMYDGQVGVYAGAHMSTYLLNNLYSNRDLIDSIGGVQALMFGNDKDFVTTYVSYKLNLKGPSVTVQTACSTSLVAVCLACQSLLSYQCDMALAGGVSIVVPQKAGYVYQQGGIFSPDGHCRAFDAKAQGTVFGDGVGIVVLKRLADALADGDSIYAVIKGSAINNDGALKVGYTAPSIDGQAEVITEALAMAGIEPETVTYIETHGTATSLGDPIEIAALTQAFRATTEARGFCAIGSVKTNIGHLNTAAGIAGLIKTVLALKHKIIPPSLHFEQPNPQINFANSPFYVHTTLSDWRTDKHPRRAGVSSFGIGGTNAHVVLEEAPPLETSEPSRPWQVLVLSAKTGSALATATANLAAYLKRHPDLNLADVAYTLQVGRRAFSHRRVFVCHSLEDALTLLETRHPARVFTNSREPRERFVTFMFPGQGAQYVHMALELYQIEPTFREQVDLCSEGLKPHLGLDLREVLYPRPEQAEEATQQLTQTWITQPALFVIEYALAKLWLAWGIHPQALIGHSIGEYVAACLADVFSLEDALALVAARGRLMQQLPAGAMLAVFLPEQEVHPLLNQQLSLAAVNGPSVCVVSGPPDAVAQLKHRLTEQGVNCLRVHTSHAFHSEMMEPILEPFTEHVKAVNLKPPKIPYVSNVTGTWITAMQATSPSYWARHLRQTVRFADGLHALLQEPECTLLEVGPGHTLSSYARSHPDKAPGQVVLASLGHAQDRQSDVACLLNTLGQLWLAGIQVDWAGFYANERRHRIPLPTYPFERQRYWIEPQKRPYDVDAHPVSLRKDPNIANWLYMPSWKRSVTPTLLAWEELVDQKSCWLVFIDACGLGAQLVKRLEQEGQRVITVIVGDRFSRVHEGVYTIDPQQHDDYDTLLKELLSLEKIPTIIVHLWSITPNDHTQSGMAVFEKVQHLGFYSLLFLVQALGKYHIMAPLRIGVVSNHIQEVTGEEVLCPEKATLLGPCKVIPQEYPNIRCLSIDIVLPPVGTWQEEKLIDQLIAELGVEPSDVVIAYRGQYRWVQTFEAVRLDDQANHTIRLREGGVYLIIDGLGEIGLVFAECLARQVRAKLMLLGLSAFPARDEWKPWLATHDDEDRVSRKIRKVQALQELGAEVVVISADVVHEEHLQTAITQAYERFGALHGVLYAAAIGGEQVTRTIPETGYIECEWQFRPKVYGVYVLERVLQGKALDFCILQSSLSSVLGGLGLSAYAGANLFIDAFAYKHNQSNRVPWISVNWDAWQFREEKEQNTAMGATLAKLAITPEEGMETFQHVLSLDAPIQIIVSTGDLQARIDQWIKLESLRDTEQAKKIASSLLHSRSHVSHASVAPRNELEQGIVDIWQKLLGIEPVGIHDNFFELGGHSLLAVQLFAHIEKRFGTRLPLASLLQAPTVAQLASLLGQEDRALLWASLVAIQPRGSKPPFFCIHAEYGEVLFYREFASLLGVDQPVYGLQAQGLDGTLPPHTTMEAMAAHYLKEIRAVQPEGPYFLGGHCLGCVIAFEMAQQLHAHGQYVALLAMMDGPGPRTNKSLRYYVHYGMQALRHHPGALARYLFLTEFPSRLKHAKRVLSRTDSRSQNELPPSSRAVSQALVQAFRQYEPRLYPGRITYFMNSERARLPLERWGEFAEQGLELHVFPGNPSTTFQSPSLQVLATQVRACLEKAQTESE